MATAYKCDRCGKLFSRNTLEYLIEDMYTSEATPLHGLYTITMEAIPDKHSYEIDLCLDCYREFEKFMQERKQNNDKSGSNQSPV